MKLSRGIEQALERVLPSNLDATPRAESPSEMELLVRRRFQDEVEDAFSTLVPLKEIRLAKVVLKSDIGVFPLGGVDTLCHIESVALLPYAQLGNMALHSAAIQQLSPAAFEDFVAQSSEHLTSAALPYSVPQPELELQCVLCICELDTEGEC